MSEYLRTLALGIACVLPLLLPAQALSQERWVGTWGAAPLPPSEAVGAFPGTPSFGDQTLRQYVRISAGGSQVRLRLTNEYGSRALTIGAASIAIVDGTGAIRPGTARVVTFGGDTRTTIAPAAPLITDPVDLAVRDFESLAISLYLPTDTGPCTCHATALQDAHLSGPGDFTTTEFEPVETIQARAFLSGIDVWTARANAVIVLGDSISDGIGSTPNANRRWPDLFAERLNTGRGRDRWGVVNMGISGNRVLNEGIGESALARFDRDVLGVPGATHVIVFEGINDLGLASSNFEGPFAALRALMPPGVDVTPDTMIAGYRQLIRRAHSKGLKIYGATIAPYEGAAYFSVDGETMRQAINDWILHSGEFDAVLDFDAVLRDADQRSRIADGLHSGDYLHGSDAGYRAIAESVALSLFR